MTSQYPIMTSQYPIMTKQKQVDIFSNILKINWNIYLQIFRPFTQYFVEVPLAEIRAWTLDATSLAHLYLRSFSHSSLQMLCQVGWGVLVHSYFQVSPEMFDRVQVWALTGPLKDIQRLVPKPLLHCFGCVLRVVVLLERWTFAPVWGPERSGTGFYEGSLYVLCFVHLSLNPDSESLPLTNSPTEWCCHHHAST